MQGEVVLHVLVAEEEPLVAELRGREGRRDREVPDQLLRRAGRRGREHLADITDDQSLAN